jgi:hypothetical protein
MAGLYPLLVHYDTRSTVPFLVGRVEFNKDVSFLIQGRAANGRFDLLSVPVAIAHVPLVDRAMVTSDHIERHV